MRQREQALSGWGLKLVAIYYRGIAPRLGVRQHSQPTFKIKHIFLHSQILFDCLLAPQGTQLHEVKYSVLYFLRSEGESSMSYGIIRVQKFKAYDVRGIQSHDRRERESKTNPDIDKERSSLNYALVESENFKADIQERLATLKSKKAVRKDAVVMCQFLVTSDHEFFQGLTSEQQKTFFQDALNYISERYGKENVLAATVHMDEKTPHMHVNITPIRDGRLTAKEIFNRTELIELQNTFHQEVGLKWGLERGQSREEKRKHQDVAEFKRSTAEAELEKVKAELEKAKMELKAFQGIPERTAQMLAQAQAWSIEKARQAKKKMELERQAKLEKEAEIKKRREQERARPSKGFGL